MTCEIAWVRCVFARRASSESPTVRGDDDGRRTRGSKTSIGLWKGTSRENYLLCKQNHNVQWAWLEVSFWNLGKRSMFIVEHHGVYAVGPRKSITQNRMWMWICDELRFRSLDLEIWHRPFLLSRPSFSFFLSPLLLFSSALLSHCRLVTLSSVRSICTPSPHQAKQAQPPLPSPTP